MNEHSMIKRITAAFAAVLTAAALLFTACSGPKKEADVQAVFEKLTATGCLSEMVPVSERDMNEIYGIELDKVKQAAFYMSENYSLNADEVAIFEAATPEYADTLEDMLNARLRSKANTAEKYSPTEYSKVTSASVVRTGNYVYFVVCEQYDELMKIMRENIG